MNKFITHGTNETRTENGKLAYKSTLNACLDLFYLINASRGQNLSAKFTAAYKEDKETALGILLYSRDIRGGQGERQQFRDIVAGNIKLINRSHLKALANAVPEVGRFDDLKVFIDEGSKTISDHAIDLWVDAIKNGNYLAAKWCPSTSRKGAAPFRKKFGMRLDKDWRKFLSEMAKANTVENIVLNTKNYAAIDYSKLPSKALNRWRKNFLEHDNKRFQDFLSAITKGEAKVNASTLYPYEVYNNLNGSYADRKLAEAQWKALPDFGTTDQNILTVLDRSGSMRSNWDSELPKGITPALIANSLALYLSERCTGAFHNAIMPFATNPKLTVVDGNSLEERANNLRKVQVGYSTDFHAVFEEILRIAKMYNVPQEDMPSKLLVVSDMQFNGGEWRCNTSMMHQIRQKFANAGYEAPQLVFWNVNARKGSIPVTADEAGVALVSGFSPTILKQILAKDLNPISLMNDVVRQERYRIENYM